MNDDDICGKGLLGELEHGLLVPVEQETLLFYGKPILVVRLSEPIRVGVGTGRKVVSRSDRPSQEEITIVTRDPRSCFGNLARFG